jgi:uncharacterized protein (DUF58 family)
MSAAAPTRLDPATVAKLEGLELRARYIVDGFLAGEHRSPHRGQSVEFAEHREYAPGDDLRYVDWKVFGKSDRVFLKQFEAETHLECYLLLDVSESMSYRGPQSPLSKLEYASCLATALMHLVIRRRDGVGLATIDDQVRQFVPATNNPAHLAHLVHVIDQCKPSGKSDLSQAVEDIAVRIRRPSVVVLLSDLLGGDTLKLALRRLRHARHDVIVMHTLDAAEIDFPFREVTLFRGLESLPDVLAEPMGVRQAYLEELSRFRERVRTDCQASQADYELAVTSEPFDVPLRRLLTRRYRRRT